MTALDCLNNNDLKGALAAAKQAIQSNAADQEARGMLAQLFCFSGEWDRADKQFEILGQQHSDMTVGVSLVRQLVRAEQARQQFYQEGRSPEVVGEPDEQMTAILKAILELREGNVAAAKTLLQGPRTHGQSLTGNVNGKPFQGGTDLDDLVSCFFEVLTTNGKFYFVPMDRVISLQFRPFERLQDRIWRSATIQIEGWNTEGEVYFPINYCADPAVLAGTEDAVRLGVQTDWYAADPDAPVRGIGQKSFVFGEEQYGIMELNSFTSASEG